MRCPALETVTVIRKLGDFVMFSFRIHMCPHVPIIHSIPAIGPLWVLTTKKLNLLGKDLDQPLYAPEFE